MNISKYGRYGCAIREADTESGRVRGLACENPRFTAFKGIPYAAPPVGKLRWKEPQPPEPWEGTRECYYFSKIPVSFFPSRPGIVNPESGMYGEESEDCLYLNVWTPATDPDERLPVIVYIFGGGALGGQANDWKYDGEGFCKRGVILVTMNYRTGPIGLLTCPQLSEETGHGSGNYYFLDQMAAIKWCRRNIRNFGGDPDRITIMGQSSGAIAATGIICSPLSKGDFIGASIISSVVARDFEGLDGIYIDRERAEQRGAAYLECCGCKTMDEMRQVSVEVLKEGLMKSPYGLHTFNGTVDGYVFPDSPVHMIYRGEQHDINYLLGSCRDEETSLMGMHGKTNFITRETVKEYAKNFGNREKDFLELVERLSDEEIVQGLFGQCSLRNIELAISQLKHGRKPAYLYNFTHRVPGDLAGAHHSADLPYIFNTLERDYRRYSGSDYELSNMMADYWANFAGTGDPNGEALPVWTPYTEASPKMMMLDETPYMEVRELSRIQQFKLEYLTTTHDAWSFV